MRNRNHLVPYDHEGSRFVTLCFLRVSHSSWAISRTGEAVRARLGDDALLHGACFDVRWVGQTLAGTHATPRAEVEATSDEEVRLAIEVRGEDRVSCTGTVRIPLP